MRGLRILPLAVLMAFLGAAVILFAVSINSKGPRNEGGTAVESQVRTGVLLRDVEMREIGKDGPQYRLTSELASYLILDRKLLAKGVTLFLEGTSGGMVVRAPKASWEMDAGRVLLEEGGAAGNGAGWSAVVAAARISLPDRLMTAPGESRLSGPGVSMTGDNLIWNWKEQRVSLLNPKTRMDSPRTFRGMR
jgi:hypothetical protein